MKKITAIFVMTVLLSMALITAFATPSPTTSAQIGGVTVETSDETVEIPGDHSNDYLKLVHVHQAEEGTELYNIGQQLKNDDSIGDVIGEEWDGSKLIQLFSLDKTDKFDGTKLTVADYILNSDGTYTTENIRIIDIKDGKITIRIDSPTFSENQRIILMKNLNGEWTQNEHVRAFNGYITMQLSFDDLGASWALMLEKAPVSPPTGESGNTVFFIGTLTVSLFALAWATKKYLAHN